MPRRAANAQSRAAVHTEESGRELTAVRARLTSLEGATAESAAALRRVNTELEEARQTTQRQVHAPPAPQAPAQRRPTPTTPP